MQNYIPKPRDKGLPVSLLVMLYLVVIFTIATLVC